MTTPPMTTSPTTISPDSCSYGTLYIVATPIGNLKDITLRALEVLQQHVDVIAAEDTRHSYKLLQHYAITTPLISLHEYNESQRSQILITQLQQGKNIALISDAGTPLISDPGYRLVHLARARNIRVVPIPGACAAITALCAAGLPTDHFVFEGFLPVKTLALEARLQELALLETRTIVIYEAPHRLLRLMAALGKIYGAEHRVTLAKELTKTFETIRTASISTLQQWLSDDVSRQKGEFVLLLHGSMARSGNSEDGESSKSGGSSENGENGENSERAGNSGENSASSKNSQVNTFNEAEQNQRTENASANSHTCSATNTSTSDTETFRILRILQQELPPAQAAKLTAKITGNSKREIYKFCV